MSSNLKIGNLLEENACASLFESPKQESKHKEDNVQQSVSHSDDGSSISLGLLKATHPTMPLPQKKPSSIG